MDADEYRNGLSFLASKDPKLSWIIANVKMKELNPRIADFEALSRIIIGQQLSGAAADTIFNRLVKLAENKKLKPDTILDMDSDLLRSVGISYSKIDFIKSLAITCQNDPSFIPGLSALSAPDCISKLIKLRGIGIWTASIFAMFYLGHRDVLATSDASIEKAVELIYGKKYIADPKRWFALTNSWSPYKTVACMVLWSWIDAKTPRIG
jgi:DNA-3-methyladenine glycosylase II